MYLNAKVLNVRLENKVEIIVTDVIFVHLGKRLCMLCLDLWRWSLTACLCQIIENSAKIKALNIMFVMIIEETLPGIFDRFLRHNFEARGHFCNYKLRLRWFDTIARNVANLDIAFVSIAV